MKSLSTNTFKIFWQHSKKYPWSILFILIGTITGVATELYTKFLYKEFFDLLSLNNVGLLPNLMAVVVKVLVVLSVGWLAWRASSIATVVFESKVMEDLLNTCFNYLQKHSNNFFTNNFAGSLQRKVNRYSRSFESIADLIIWQAGTTFLRVTAIIVIILWRYTMIGYALLIWAFFFVVFNLAFAKFKLKYDLKKSATDTQTTGFLADTITNNTNIKLFTGYEFESKGFKALTTKWRKITKFTWDLDSASQAFQSSLTVLVQYFVFKFGLDLWKNGQLTIGDFVLIQSYILIAADHLWDLGRFLKSYFENMADANEMTEILLTPYEIDDLPNAKKLKISAGQIEFKKAHFGYYQAQNVFEDFNLVIKGGERIALIGPSGGGKSTIVKLLFRFFDIQSGEILIDGQNISKVTQDSLRQNVALVPQDPILFHRSILENIRYAKPEATEEQVIEAAKLAHCHEFIMKFPEQYKTFVGERGVKLSGGERQRVAIARAILKNAPILVLDEATSSLDSESEMFIQEALKKLMQNKTTIVIAHRLSTIMQMDRILVLENGAIVEQGKHKELLKLKKGTYQKLWEIQAGSFN